jgi:hypothetical protein
VNGIDVLHPGKKENSKIMLKLKIKMATAKPEMRTIMETVPMPQKVRKRNLAGVGDGGPMRAKNKEIHGDVSYSREQRPNSGPSGMNTDDWWISDAKNVGFLRVHFNAKSGFDSVKKLPAANSLCV